MRFNLGELISKEKSLFGLMVLRWVWVWSQETSHLSVAIERDFGNFFDHARRWALEF